MCADPKSKDSPEQTKRTFQTSSSPLLWVVTFTLQPHHHSLRNKGVKAAVRNLVSQILQEMTWRTLLGSHPMEKDFLHYSCIQKANKSITGMISA